jgi:uncharacterized protein
MNELIVEKKDFSHDHLNHLKTVHLNTYPIVYILYNDNKKPSAYIGQTVQAARRLKNMIICFNTSIGKKNRTDP